jgi:hypothetical protein
MQLGSSPKTIDSKPCSTDDYPYWRRDRRRIGYVLEKSNCNSSALI